jgi:hypothetical protein
MKQTLRWALLVVLLLLLSAGGLLLWIVQHDEDVESAVLESIASHLLTDAHIGDVALDIWDDFPQISLRLEDVVLMGSSGDPSDTLLQANRLQLHCNAFQLLRGRYQIESASLEGGNISLISAPNGTWNTDVWKTDSEDTESDTRFAIHGLTLRDCGIQINEASLQIPGMQIEGAWESATLLATLEGDVQNVILIHGAEPLPPANLKLMAQWDEGSGGMAIEMPQAIWLEGQWHTEANYSSDSGWTCSGGFERIPAREVLPWLALPKPFDSIDSEVDLSGQFNWSDGALGVQIALPNAPWSIVVNDQSDRIEGPFQASIWAKYADQRWRIDAPQWALELDGVQVNGALNNYSPEKGSFASSSVEAKFNAEQLVSWRALLDSENRWPTQGWGQWTGEIARDARAQWTADGTWNLAQCIGSQNGTPYRIEANGTLNTNALTIEQSKIAWGKQSFTGTAVFKDPLDWKSGNPLRGQVDIQMESWSYQETAESPVLLTDLELPTGSRIDWALACDRGHYGGWTLNNIEAEGRLEPLVWGLRRFRSETLEGQLSGDGQILFIPQEDRAVVQWHPVATELNLPELFQAFDNFDQSTLRAEHLQGLLTASGSLQFDWNHSLNWQSETFEMLAEARIENGALRQLEAFESIAQYLRENRIMAPLVDPDDLAKRLQNVVFEPLESPLYVAKQSVHLPDVQIRSSAMNISLEGSYAFDGNIDYTLGFAMRDLRNNREDQFGPIEDDGLGQQFFIQMTGNDNSPEYGWDREAQRNHRKSNFQREKELLKSLFKRS